MKTEIKVAPSIIAADQARLGEEVKRMEQAGADLFHIDVMDGHFVPNITIGPDVLKALDKVTNLPMEAHLMIYEPEKYIKAFSDAGADYITVHIEACMDNAPEVISQIKSLGRKAGVALNPATPLSAIEHLLEEVDLVLVMSVNPGFSGQAFMPSALLKIDALRKAFKGTIAVDGGINQDTGRSAVSSGASILACGSYVFAAADPHKVIQDLKNA